TGPHLSKGSTVAAAGVDIDSEFEPHSRSRSCTWPLPCPEDFPGGEEASRGLIKHPAGAPAPVVAAPACMSGAALDVAGQLRKAKSSRRNAWGNLSYADLITRAIESAPEKRLTLSQIYDWMVRFVPYFKDKGDSNSSAGWKVACLRSDLHLLGWNITHASGWVFGIKRLEPPRPLLSIVRTLNYAQAVRKHGTRRGV
uniref:Fork-head domain-containing protein n=1 Tax=Lates calcarifer TaxID=8187 RepID=A0A4W6BZC0_LATCA